MRAVAFAFAFALILLVALGGCTSVDRCVELCPSGDPTVLQVLVSNGVADDGVSGLALAYGAHPSVAGGEPVVGVRARAVPRVMPRFRVVIDRLLDGRTLEEFECLGGGFISEPYTCAGCPDDPATAFDESNRCLDENNDRVPDHFQLIAGIAMIRCPGLVYVTVAGDGYYYPSGNQLFTSGFGLEGLGPAIVLEPGITLPPDVDCRLDLLPGIMDKQERELDWPKTGVSFHSASD